MYVKTQRVMYNDWKRETTQMHGHRQNILESGSIQIRRDTGLTVPTWPTTVSTWGQHGSDHVSLSLAGLAVHLLEENGQIFVIDWRFSCFVFKTRLHFFSLSELELCLSV